MKETQNGRDKIENKVWMIERNQKWMRYNRKKPKMVGMIECERELRKISSLYQGLKSPT